MRRSSLATRVVVAAGLLIAGTALAPSGAVAAVGTMSADGAVAATDRLGDTRTGGAYIDATGRAVVTVTDAAAAASVRAAGGTAQLVKYSTAQLTSVASALDAGARIPGTSWGVDPSTNKVSVEIDSTVTGAELARLESITKRYGDAVQVDRIGGKIEKTAAFTSGGQGIQGTGTKCSLGFNVRTPEGRFFLTAGHCKPNSWEKAADGTYLGKVVYRVWPNKDFALVEYDNSDVTAYGTVWVNGAQKQIASSRYPRDGESVSRVGTTSSDLVGAVLLTSTTVTYDTGETVTGVIKTSNCTRRGDSGGALFSGSVALGITSGGNFVDAGCSDAVSDRRSYYQPVQEVLTALGQEVY
ncbi:serine protease [Paractinoplanes abujensis]|uniref:Serine protease n=1 Tax=Paractinoplanes abujensis TaxID=882441 RepID=A0A7W7CK05_9ACTN|nr:S1 family peptidase [Actinoplanes abujensis]MBB4689982.1 hypothetical protein [Actinoplanes abujensis]GID20755.1 serine protease [Actinoplanes abujensis]